MRHRIILVAALFFANWLCLAAQDDRGPGIHGTVRAKFEYEPEIKSTRFEVRNARIGFSGNIATRLAYKAEIDLSDEGTIKMLDAYFRVKVGKSFRITAGQMRVPFSIDAHRSPHEQYFANRSFIAKQVGNVRDVGLMAGYTAKVKNRDVLLIDAGIFNGSGLTAQKNAWHRDWNFSARIQAFPLNNWNITASVQRGRVTDESMHYLSMGIGTYYHSDRLHLEAEYLVKTYDSGYSPCHTVDIFGEYKIPITKSKEDLPISGIGILARFDTMGDHANGIDSFDAGRMRLTAGLSVYGSERTRTSLRLNYEKYWYTGTIRQKESELDKLVLELMVHF